MQNSNKKTTISLKKIDLKMLCAKWQPFCLGLSVLSYGMFIVNILEKIEHVI